MCNLMYSFIIYRIDCHTVTRNLKDTQCRCLTISQSDRYFTFNPLTAGAAYIRVFIFY